MEEGSKSEEENHDVGKIMQHFCAISRSLNFLGEPPLSTNLTTQSKFTYINLTSNF